MEDRKSVETLTAPTAAPNRTVPARYGLRRRILLIVLLVTFVPSLLTLVVTTGVALSAIRVQAFEEARSAVLTLSERFGDRIQAEAGAIRELASEPSFSVAAHVMADDESAIQPSARRDMFAQIQVVDSQYGARSMWVSQMGRVSVPLGGDVLLPAGVETALFATLKSGPPGTLFLIEAPVEEGTGSPSMWAAARLADRVDDPAEGIWIVRELGVTEMIKEIERFALAGEQPPFLVSETFGVLTRPADRASAGLMRRKAEFFDALAGEVPADSGQESPYVYSRIAAIQALGRGTSSPTTWVIAKPVNLAAPTNALLTGIWQILIYGIVFVLMATVLGWWLSTRLVAPIKRLRSGFNRLRGGDLEYRVQLSTNDELQDLAESMNEMALTLQESYKTLADKLLLLDEKAKQLTLTYEISKAINRSLELDKLLRDIVTEIHQLVPADYAAVGLLHENSSTLEIAYEWGEESATSQRIDDMPLHGSFSAQCIESGNVGVFSLLQTGTTAEEVALRGTGASTLCVVPLRTTTGPMGVLLLADSFEGAFRRQEIDVLKQVAQSLATAVEHGRLYEQQGQFALELERQVVERTKDLKRAQDALLQTEKLAAAGELATHVAHEINNPLGIIKNYLKLLQMQMLRPKHGTEDTEVTRQGIVIIGEEIDRIARIVDQLRKVNVPVTPDIVEVDMNREITQIAQLFEQTFQQKRLQIVVLGEDSMPNVRLCRDHLRQILINLLRNAHDATDAHGAITLRLQRDIPAERWFTLSVRDTGSGIPAEHLSKIFDPFFTTKKDGKGTGLGLSVSFGLARNMGGRIEVESHVGRGSDFRIILPMNVASDDTDPTTTIPGNDPRRSGVIRMSGQKIIIG